MCFQFRNHLLTAAVGVLYAVSAGAVPARAAVITNGGFETGDLTGWTLSNSSAFDAVCVAGVPIGASTCIANSGIHAMAFGQFNAVATLSQTIATTTGNTYTISFFLANDNPDGDPVETFAVRWDGATVFSLPSPQAAFGYSQRVIFNLTATSSSAVLAFDAQHDPYSWYLDDVSIADAPVPEPASLFLTGFGLAAVAAASKRLRRGAA